MKSIIFRWSKKEGRMAQIQEKTSRTIRIKKGNTTIIIHPEEF